MFNKSLQYSVAAQKRERHRALRAALSLFALFLLYNAINSFLLSTWVVRGDSMGPGLRDGDRLLVFSSTLPFLFSGIGGRGRGAIPFDRGGLVLVDKSRAEGRNPFLVAADGFARFFTAQRVSLLGDRVYARRLVALPGDEVGMAGFVMRVRPEGGVALTEFEFARRPYVPTFPQAPALWDAALPFSGNMDPVAIGPGEAFVVSDDRGIFGDSRTWGPIGAGTIIGRPVFRFWPPSRIGFP